MTTTTEKSTFTFIKRVSALDLPTIQKSKYPLPTIDKHGFYVTQDIWNLLVRNALRKINTMLTGPTGSGKTEIMLLAASVFNLPIHIFDMGAMHDPMAGLLGVHRIRDGKSIFDYSKLSRDIASPGIILLDEITRAPANSNNILFPLLDSRRTLPVDIAASDGARNVPVHEDVVFFATANQGYEYTGTHRIDRALYDRFFVVEMQYPPKGEESKIIVARTGVDLKIAETISDIAATIRSKASEGHITKAISTRHTLMTAELIRDGFPLKKALESVILPLYDDDGGSTENESSDRDTVKAIFASK